MTVRSGRNWLIWVLLATLIAAAVIPGTHWGAAAQQLVAAPEVTAEVAYVFDATLGVPLFEKNADERWAPASLTKLISAQVAVETLASLDEEVTIDAADVISVDAGESIMGLTEGDVLTARQLLIGMLLPSGNDAALAMARYAGAQLLAADGADGDPIERFVVAMNDFASAHGLASTHFTNPAGLFDEDHYSTARELGLIVTVALNQPDISEIVAMPEATFESIGLQIPYELKNTNQLLGDANVIGMKTGTLPESGACLAAARHAANGNIIVGIVLGSDVEFDEFGVQKEGTDMRYDDMRQLLDQAESDYRWIDLSAAEFFPGLDEELAAWQVTLQESSTIVLPAAEAEGLRYRLQLQPVSEPGSEVGQVFFYAGESVVAQRPVVQL